MYAVWAFLVSTGISGAQAQACVSLKASGPVEVQSDNQVIENLDIVTTDLTPGINCNGKANVQILNVRVTHHDVNGDGPLLTGGTNGIRFIQCNNMTIRNVRVQMAFKEGIINQCPIQKRDHGKPVYIPGNCSLDWRNFNIFGRYSNDTLIDNVIASGGSTGISLASCLRAHVSNYAAYNFRGPFPRGQCIQLETSDYGVLENFICKNQWEYSWPEDLISVYRSANSTVRNGVVLGSNSENGVSVMFEQSMALDYSWGLLENVLGSQIGSGFSSYGGTNILFKDVGLRDNHKDGVGGRGLVSSGGVMYYAGAEDTGKGMQVSSNLTCENCMWWNNSGWTVFHQDDKNCPHAWVREDSHETNFAIDTDKYNITLCFNIQGAEYRASSVTEENVGLFGNGDVAESGGMPPKTFEMQNTATIEMSAPKTENAVVI